MLSFVPEPPRGKKVDIVPASSPHQLQSSLLFLICNVHFQTDFIPISTFVFKNIISHALLQQKSLTTVLYQLLSCLAHCLSDKKHISSESHRQVSSQCQTNHPSMMFEIHILEANFKTNA